MPWAAKTICTKPGCGVVVPKPGFALRTLPSTGRATTNDVQRDRIRRDQFYHTARWQRLRASVLEEEPLCRTCGSNGRVTLAVLVDHIVPVKDGGEMWDRANLQPLCNACHEAKSAAEGSRFVRRRA